MNVRPGHCCPSRRLRAFCWVGLVCLFAGLPVRAEERVAVGRLVTLSGTAFAREQPDKAWHYLQKDETIHTRDLLLGLPGGAIVNTAGTVRLDFLADLDELSPLPIVETAVVLHEAKDADLDFTLDRGRVDLVNLREKGAARARVRFRDQQWELTLAEPGTRVALEIVGRWPPGVRFQKDAKPEHGPPATLILLVLKGEVQRKCPVAEHSLKAPPGPALFQWDSVSGNDESPQRLDKLPDWAAGDVAVTERGKQIEAALQHFRKEGVLKEVADVLTEMANSDNPVYRSVAVRAMGAFDELPLLGEVLLSPKAPDVWENAVITLRHWIGRAPGQDTKLYKLLIEKRNYTPAQAETVVQLLHSFGLNDVTQPETFETLIEYLKHEKPSIRGLAAWHLYRLVPAAKNIAYNPNGSKEELQRAYNEWKKLVPSGKLPPKTDKKGTGSTN